jgi:hypothetical protein
MIITEAVWNEEPAFLESPSMRLIPRAEVSATLQSWWLVSPVAAAEILKLLGFDYLRCTYHHEQFNGTQYDGQPRKILHYTIGASRPDCEISFLEGWNQERESSGIESWRWSSGSHATLAIDLPPEAKQERNLLLKLHSSLPARISLFLNEKPIAEFDCSTQAEHSARQCAFSPGKNLLEIRSDQPAISPSENDSRLLGFALHGLMLE